MGINWSPRRNTSLGNPCRLFGRVQEIVSSTLVLVRPDWRNKAIFSCGRGWDEDIPWPILWRIRSQKIWSWCQYNPSIATNAWPYHDLLAQLRIRWLQQIFVWLFSGAYSMKQNLFMLFGVCVSLPSLGSQSMISIVPPLLLQIQEVSVSEIWYQICWSLSLEAWISFRLPNQCLYKISPQILEMAVAEQQVPLTPLRISFVEQVLSASERYFSMRHTAFERCFAIGAVNNGISWQELFEEILMLNGPQPGGDICGNQA